MVTPHVAEVRNAAPGVDSPPERSDGPADRFWPGWRPPPSGSVGGRIRKARKAHGRPPEGWTQGQLMLQMYTVAARRGVDLPAYKSLRVQLSRWENNRTKPNQLRRRILAEALGVSLAGLGLDDDADGDW